MNHPQQPGKNREPQQSPQQAQSAPAKGSGAQGAPATGSGELQGEGNYDATRRFDKAERQFVESGKVDEAARAAKPRSPQEANELQRAETEARSHSKGEDPRTKAGPGTKR